MNCTVIRQCSELEAEALTYFRGGKNYFSSNLLLLKPLPARSQVLAELDDRPEPGLRIAIIAVHGQGDCTHQVSRRLKVVYNRIGFAPHTIT